MYNDGMAQRRQEIKTPWLNSMHHWTIGGDINRRPSQVASVTLGSYGLDGTERVASGVDMASPIGYLAAERVRDPKLFFYTIEAIGARFNLVVWMGWFGFGFWRKWEDNNKADLDGQPTITSGISLKHGRRRYLREGDLFCRHDHVWQKKVAQ